MSDLPKIYGTCKAGCLWETVHREEFLRSASIVEVKPYSNAYDSEMLSEYLPVANATSHILEIGKSYKMRNSAKETIGDSIPADSHYWSLWNLEVYLVILTDSAAHPSYKVRLNYSKATMTSPSDVSRGFLKLRLDEIIDGTEGNKVLWYTIQGEPTSTSVKLDAGVNATKIFACACYATEVYLINEDAEILAKDGASAYESAVANGFEGTEAEWIGSLHGKDGKDGKDGISVDAEIVHSTGDSEKVVMSQKAVTNELNNIIKRENPCVIDENTPTEHGYLSAGEYIATPAQVERHTTDFIELEPNVVYMCEISRKVNNAQNTTPDAIYFYDSNKVYTKSASIPADLNNLYLENNEKYIRLAAKYSELEYLRVYPKDKGYVDELYLNDKIIVPQVEELKELKEKNKALADYSGARSPIISFIFDGDYDLNATVEALFDTHGMKVGFAPQYTTAFGYNSKDTYLEWQSKGHEILAHGNYILGETNSYTDEQAISYITNSYKKMKGYGFDVHGFIGSSGAVAERYLPTIKKYYDYASTKNNHVGASESNIYFNTDNPFKLWRYSVGSSTIEQLKQAVDRAIETNGLLMLITHADSNRSSEGSISKLTQLVDYLKPLINDYKVEVKTPYEAIKDYYSIRYDDIMTN